MEGDVSRLVEKVKGKVQGLAPNQRYLVGISGIPGSGKTTLGRLVTTQLATSLPSAADSGPAAVFVGMDGFHLTRAQLSAMADPAEAHRRRGAAFTFDGDGFVDLVARVRANAPGVAIKAPSFDHAVKDPMADDVDIPASAKVVVFEGNYLALDSQPWKKAGEMMDEIWFVEVEENVARERLAKRHLAAGIVQTLEDGVMRADDNDLPNGREIVAGRWKVDETVVSKDDPLWRA